MTLILKQSCFPFTYLALCHNMHTGAGEIAGTCLGLVGGVILAGGGAQEGEVSRVHCFISLPSEHIELMLNR